MILESAKVTTSTEPMAGSRLLWLESPQVASEAQPGQFVMVRCGEKGEHQLRRPLSIHQREGDNIALLFNIVGGGTHWLSQRTPADRLDLLGPLGNGFKVNPESKLLMIAGGIGIAPMVFLAEEAVKLGLSPALLYGAPTSTQLYYPHLPNEVNLVTSTEDGSEGKKGMITDYLHDYINLADQTFACGPLAMYKTMAKMPELKYNPVQISLEVRMGCGLGVCYGCTVKTKNDLKQVCKDGPIFELNDILWEELAD